MKEEDATPEGEEKPKLSNGELSSGGSGDSSGFFSLSADELESYRLAGVISASRKKRSLKAILKVVAAIGLICALAFAVYLLWPSSVVRVPNLLGKNLSEAIEIARKASLEPQVSGWEYSQKQKKGEVISQKPPSGKSVRKGSRLKLTVSKGLKPLAGSEDVQGLDISAESTALQTAKGKTVCIDPGHGEGILGEEWIDPELRRMVFADEGARGISTGNPEYSIALDLSGKLLSLLDEEGVKVVLTRNSNDVKLNNIDRAEIANSVSANLSVHIHCSYSSDSRKNGITTYYPKRNEWTESFYEKSKLAALYIQSELVKSCKATDNGVFQRDDLACFNWSKVPTVQVEVGYLSNRGDDASLADDDFRWSLAWGLRSGITKFLSEQ
ncbi:MAG: N-acetylmuramoyl-L-alanine amidase [Actinomycetota bacterium]|nr:N-acetylmuramoyl-L-alanine amidase [Actinomycetota bacterium]